MIQNARCGDIFVCVPNAFYLCSFTYVEGWYELAQSMWKGNSSSHIPSCSLTEWFANVSLYHLFGLLYYFGLWTLVRGYFPLSLKVENILTLIGAWYLVGPQTAC